MFRLICLFSFCCLFSSGLAATCQVNDVCSYDAANEKASVQSALKRALCSGSCPTATACTVDSNYCSYHPDIVQCNMQRASVSTCQWIPPPAIATVPEVNEIRLTPDAGRNLYDKRNRN